MSPSRSHSFSRILESFSTAVTKWAGSSSAFAIAVLVIIVWAITGPLFGFSDTWQLVINTGTTVVTFLMVFLIQRSQNKDALAIHLKLNELVAASPRASNRLVEIEDLNEDELNLLRAYYIELARLAKKETRLAESHSVEEAVEHHKLKRQRKNG